MGMNELKVSDFFKTRHISWAAYDNLRSISSAIDGLVIARRKAIFTVKKKNIIRDTKVSALANTVILEAEYLHGDASLTGVISNMAQQFTGSNNLSWLSPESAFGTRHDPVASAPRYVYTKKPEWFDILIPSEDDDILEHQTFEGHNIDPKYYLPILPMLLINGGRGTTPGAKQMIFNRSPKKIMNHIITLLEGKKSNYDFVPYWTGFQGSVEQGDTPRQWKIKGKCEIKNTTTVEITEVPINYSYKKYISVLDDLEEANKISSYEDYCDPKTGKFHFIVKFTRQNLADMTVPKLMDLLKLVYTDSEIYTVVDEKNRIAFLETIQDVFDIYFKTRLDGYVRRKEAMIKSLKYDIEFNQNKADFIFKIMDETILPRHLYGEKSEVEKMLADRGLKRFDDGYDSLLNMGIRSLTKDGYARLEAKVEELKSQLKYVEETTAEQMWINDLKKISKFIKD